MPRLPGVRDVTRVSTNRLRLPALDAPATDPTGAALQEFGQSLGTFGEALDDFQKKRKKLKASEDVIQRQEFGANVTRDRVVSSPSGRGETAGENSDGPSPDIFLSAEERLQRIQDPEQRARMKETLDAQREAHRINVDVEDHNFRAAALASRVDGVLDTLRETVRHKPEMHEVSRERGLDALRANRESLGLTEETLKAQETVFERDLLAEAVRARIERGEAAEVFEQLKDPENRSLFGEAAAERLAQEAEARQISEVTAILSSLDIHTEAIADTGLGIDGLSAEAAAKLPPEESVRFKARERAAQAAHDFGQRFEQAPRTALESDVDSGLVTAFPGESASEEDQDKFDALRNKRVAMLKERDTNPGAIAGRDPVVAALRRTGKHQQAASLALSIQERMEVPAANRRVLAVEEARSEAAALDGQLIVERPLAILKLKEKYGRHFDAVFGEMRAEGLDPETAALAAVTDNPKKLQALLPALGVPYAQLTEGKTPDQIADLQTAVETQRETMIQTGRLDPGIEPFVLQKAALRGLDQNGDIGLSVKRGTEIFAKPASASTDANAPSSDDTLAGGSGADRLLESADDIQLAQGQSIENGLDLKNLFDENGELNDTEFGLLAEEADLIPERMVLLRDLIREAENGLEEGNRKVLMSRIDAIFGVRENSFRTLLNSLEAGRKVKDASNLVVMMLPSVSRNGKEETGVFSIISQLFFGRGGKTSNVRMPKQTGNPLKHGIRLTENGVRLPALTKGNKNFKQGYDNWLETKGLDLIRRRSENRLEKIAPSESFIWQSLPVISPQAGTRGNGLTGSNLRYFQYDFGESEIEVYNRARDHLGAMDPLTGEIKKDSKVKGRELPEDQITDMTDVPSIRPV